MTIPGDTHQDDELSRLYATYSDGELQALAATLTDLTDAAQSALKAEFTRRGLALPSQSAAPTRPNSSADESALHTFAANAPEECVFEFTDLEDALLAQSVLRSAGIESIVPTSEIVAADPPRLIVGPSDAQSAGIILSRPNALGTISPEDAIFTEPVCPQCGAADPLLEAVDPANRWHCEACGHSWTEDLPL